MKKQVYTLDEIANKNRNFRKPPYKSMAKQADDDFNPYSKRNTALREIPRTSLKPPGITGENRSKSTLRGPDERSNYLQEPGLMDDDNVYVKGMKRGNNNILVAVRTRPVNKKEKKWSKEKGLADKCIKVMDEKI